MGECFQTLNLTNAYLFAAALQDEEICRNVLEIALNREITAVRSHAEHTLFLDSDFKSVRLIRLERKDISMCSKNTAKRQDSHWGMGHRRSFLTRMELTERI